MDFNLTIQRDDRTTSIVAFGELDIASAPELATALGDGHVEGARLIVLDLSDVTFIDSTGLATLITASHQLAGRLQILPSEPCLRLAKLTGAQYRLPLVVDDGFERDRVAILRNALELAMLIGAAPMGNAQVVDPQMGNLRIVTQVGLSAQFLDFFATVDHGAGTACGSAMRQGSAMWVGDAAHSPIFAGTEALDVILNAGSRACASVPICAPSGDIIAMLSPHYGRTTNWTTEQKHDLTLLATKTGAAIHDLSR